MGASEHLDNILHADEVIVAHAVLPDVRLAVTDRRLAVVTDYRIALDLPYRKLRRIQFDVERTRPATLVIVPEEASAEPQVLAVPPDTIESVAQAVGAIGLRLSEI